MRMIIANASAISAATHCPTPHAMPSEATSQIEAAVVRPLTISCSAFRIAPPLEMFAGERDPLVDRNAIANLTLVSGAHACHFSHPEECAKAIVP